MHSYLFTLCSICLLISGCNKQIPSINLTKNNQSSYEIIVSNDADTLTYFAAKELKDFIEKVSNVTLSINKTPQNKTGSIIIGKGMVNKEEIRLDTLSDDGFLIQIKEGEILLAGRNSKSTLYAVYTFLEEYTGCRMFTPTEYYIPQQHSLQIPIGTKVYEPDFLLRKLNFSDHEFKRYKLWNKLEDLEDWGSFVHTFHELIPPDKYFDIHPEYFSLVRGHRLKDGQLCLSNPETIHTLIENLRFSIEKNPDKTYWSVSQNDCFNYCECRGCKAMYDKYESISGAYIHMANEIAKEFPDKQISTLAYNLTRSAPKNIVPLSNVNIMFCSIECNRSMPLLEDSRSADFVKDMKDWNALTSNIFAWDYVVQFKNFLTPFPNFYALQPNLHFFHDHGVNIMFEQGSGGNWSDMNELKQYLLAKLMWDTDADVEYIINDFITKYYGKAASHIRSYFNLTHQTLKEHEKTERLDIYGYPSDYLDSYLALDKLKAYKNIMDMAEAVVKNDSLYLKRVQRARLAVDFAYLDIALNKGWGDISFLEILNDSVCIRQDMLDYLDRFTRNSEYTGGIHINERLFRTEAYRDYALNKLRRMTTPNLAKGKKIEVLSTYSQKYPVGGGKALNDGVVGELDYHQKWLGFEGDDMIVLVDLEKKQAVNRVSVNFLKAINSWTFLPIKVTVEGSVNGVSFTTLGAKETTDKDRGFLVKSVPYSISFDPVQTRYVRVKATSVKQCPEWHRGYGNPSWLFADELIME